MLFHEQFVSFDEVRILPSAAPSYALSAFHGKRNIERGNTACLTTKKKYKDWLKTNHDVQSSSFFTSISFLFIIFVVDILRIPAPLKCALDVFRKHSIEKRKSAIDLREACIAQAKNKSVASSQDGRLPA